MTDREPDQGACRFPAARYNAVMRRRTLLVLAVLALPLVLFGAYAAYWLIVASQVRDGVSAWAQAQQARKGDIAWQKIGVGGFPLAYRVEFDNAAQRDGRVSPSPEVRIPTLFAAARPWDFADWQLAAPEGISASLPGAGERPPLKIAAKTAAGVLNADEEAGAALWLRLRDIDAEAGERVPISSADAWITLPPKSAVGIAVDLRQMQLPDTNPVLGNTI